MCFIGNLGTGRGPSGELEGCSVASPPGRNLRVFGKWFKLFHISFSISLASLVVLNLENPPCPPTALPFKIISQFLSHLEES